MTQTETVDLLVTYKLEKDHHGSLHFRDKEVEEVVTQLYSDAEWVGQGTFIPTMQRDIQFEVPEKHAKRIATALREAGFGVEITVPE
jgi:hypothetical protein